MRAFLIAALCLFLLGVFVNAQADGIPAFNDPGQSAPVVVLTP